MFKTILCLAAILFTSVALSCPSGTELLVENNQNYCLLKGRYLESELNLTSDFIYRLDDEGVFIGGDNKANSIIRIQEGTKIVGEPKSFLAIMRGSKIFAEGSQLKPIVFTTINTSNRKRGEWGGIVISGNAPINACKAGTSLCEAVSEGIKVEQIKFGGNDPMDNSGILRYVRVEFPGYPIAQDNELNGITFNAVGAGTEVDFVQVMMSADDGIEVFGGTVNLKHIVLSGIDDDSLDWDFGWQGKVQYLLAVQADDSADNGIEADNFKSPMNAEPRSNPTFSNATFIGGKNSAYGLLLRRGTAGVFLNTIITGFKKACVDIDDAETFNHNGIKIENSLIFCTTSAEVEDGDLWVTSSWLEENHNYLLDPQLSGYYPLATSPAIGTGVTPDDLFFEPVDYIGAFSSDSDNWESGWTSWLQE
jgi:hypothetical protein